MVTNYRPQLFDRHAPLAEAPKRLCAEKDLIFHPYSAQRIRHAGGAQTGAMVKPLLTALVGLGVLAGIIATIPHWSRWSEQAKRDFIAMSADNGYVVQNVQVTGRDRVPGAALLAALNIQRGMPMFAYDPEQAQQAVQDLPGVKNVFIERRWPNTVFIRLTERQPAVRWQQDEQLAVVDRDGGVVSVKPDEDVSAYPIVVGPGATKQIKALFALLQGEPDLISHIKAATWVGDRRWDLMLQNNLVIKLPAENASLALSRLMKLARTQDLFEKDLAVVDVRLPHQAVLRPTKRADLMIERPDFSDPGKTGKKNI